MSRTTNVSRGDGGTVGLTEHSAELLRWMVSGPEIARVIGAFEASLEDIKTNAEPQTYTITNK